MSEPKEAIGVCFPWRLRGIADSGELTGPGKVIPGFCCFCNRDISVPKRHQPRKANACIYCAIDRGWQPEDGPIDPREARDIEERPA